MEAAAKPHAELSRHFQHYPGGNPSLDRGDVSGTSAPSAEVARLTELLAVPDIMAELVRRARRRQMMTEEVLLAMQYWRSSARGPIDLPSRPPRIEMDHPDELAVPLFAESRDTHATRRMHAKSAKFDRWRNSGGKRGVLCTAVPKELVNGQENVVLCRRKGFVDRDGRPMLRYFQFTLGRGPRPTPENSDLILYQVLVRDGRPTQESTTRRKEVNAVSLSHTFGAKEDAPHTPPTFGDGSPPGKDEGGRGKRKWAGPAIATVDYGAATANIKREPVEDDDGATRERARLFATLFEPVGRSERATPEGSHIAPAAKSEAAELLLGLQGFADQRRLLLPAPVSAQSAPLLTHM